MADSLNRKINIWINDTQVVNSYKGITSSIKQARNQLANMTIGSKDYIAQTKKISKLNGVLDKHKMAQGGILKGWKKIKNEIKQIAVGNTIANVFTGALSKVGEAFNFITSSVGEAERGLTNVLTLMSDADVEKYGDTLAKGSIEIMKLGNAQKDTNKALFDAVSAGVDAGKSIEFLTQANVLAKGGVTTLGVAVDGTTTLVNAYNMSLDESGNVMDAYFSAQKQGKTTVEELATSIGKVAPIASNVGVKYQELLSASAKLTKGGISTSESMTYLKAALGNLMKPGTAATKILEKYNIPMGASQLKTVGFTETLNRLNSVVKKSPDLLAKMIPSIEGQNAILALTGANFEDYQTILNDVTNDIGKNSSLQKAYAKQMETLPNVLAKAKGELTALAVSVGKKLAPAIKAIIPYISGFAKKIMQLIDFVVDNIQVIKLMAGAILAYVAAMKIQSSWTKIVTALQAAKRTGMLLMALAQAKLTKNTIRANAAQKMLNISMKANPIGLIITGITAIYGAYKYFTREVKENRKELEEGNKVGYKYAEMIGDEKSNLIAVFEAAKKTTKGTNERKKAIQQINKQYGDYLPSLLKETASLRDIEEAQRLANRQLMRSIALKAKQYEIAEVIKQQLILEKKEWQELTDNERKYFNQYREAFREGQLSENVISKILLTLRDNGKLADKEVRNIQASLYRLGKENTGLSKKKKEIEDFYKSFENEIDPFKNRKITGIFGDKDKQKELDLFEKYSKEYQRLQGELGKARTKFGLDKRSKEDIEIQATNNHYADMLAVVDSAIFDLEEKAKTKKGLSLQELALLNNFYNQQITLTEMREAELAGIRKKYEDAKIKAKADVQIKIDNILRSDADKEIKAITDKYTNLIKLAKEYGIDTVELYAKMQAELDALKQKGKPDAEEDILGMSPDKWDKFKKNFDNAMQLVGKMQDIYGSFNTIRSNNEAAALAEYEANNEKRKDIAKERLDKGLISEENYNLRVGYMEEALEKKKRKAAYDQAKRDKQSKIFDAVINTASAVVQSIPNPYLMAFSAAAGAAGIAAIASEPLPAYGDGGRINTPQIAIVGEKGSEVMMSNKMLTDSTYGPIVEDLARVQEGKKPKFLNQPAKANFAGMDKATMGGSSTLVNNNTVVNQVDSAGMEAMTSEMTNVRNSMSEVTSAIKELKYLKAVISQREMNDRDDDEELLMRYSIF